MNISKRAFAALVAVSFSAANAADPHAVMLSAYEPLYQLELRAAPARVASKSPATDAGPRVMRFVAMGRSFDLELEPNRRLLLAASRDLALDGIEIYRGALAGKPGSWARIVVADGMPSGMIWDGNEMFAIEAPGDSLVDGDDPVIFRLSDVEIAPGAMSCGSASLAMTGAEAFDSLVGELGTIAEAQGAIEEIGMGVIGDYEFTSAKGGDANAAAAIMTRMNIVDGIFSTQLGVQITVNTIETFSAPSDPFSDERDSGLLLDEVSDYRSQTPAQNSNGLTHLYTGKDLDGTTVGVAWTGALCSNYFGAGLSEGNGSAMFDSLVAAHEIGHNFGAPHDGESGSACEAETGSWLMSARLNGTDQFSSCSIREMSDDIARASCITALPAVDMQPTLGSSSSVLFGAGSVITVEVVNNGTIDATGVAADLVLPPNLALDSISASQGSCTNTGGTVTCDVGGVPGLAVRTVDLAVTPTALGAATIMATVSADVDERSSNDQQALQVSVDPAVDLVVNTPAGSTLRVDRETTITATLENRASLDATGVTVTMDLGTSLQATAASWPIGTCSVTSQRVTCQASSFRAASNTAVSVTASAVTEGSPRINYSLASNEPDLVPTDNTGSVRIEVRDPDESGSGPLGPLFLGLLSLAALLRRRG